MELAGINNISNYFLLWMGCWNWLHPPISLCGIDVTALHPAQNPVRSLDDGGPRAHLQHIPYLYFCISFMVWMKLYNFVSFLFKKCKILFLLSASNCLQARFDNEFYYEIAVSHCKVIKKKWRKKNESRNVFYFGAAFTQSMLAITKIAHFTPKP